MRDFRKLEIWNLGMELVTMVYHLVKKLPPGELFGLSLQMRKAVISMPSNIAEGCSRSSNKDTARFFEISIGSSFEMETQVLAGCAIGFFSSEDSELIVPKLHTFQKQTMSYKNTMV